MNSLYKTLETWNPRLPSAQYYTKKLHFLFRVNYSKNFLKSTIYWERVNASSGMEKRDMSLLGSVASKTELSYPPKVPQKSEMLRTIIFHKTFKMYSLFLKKKWLSGAIKVGPHTQGTMNISNTNCSWESLSYSGMMMFMKKMNREFS